MAEVTNQKEMPLEKLEREITCALCHEKAKLLPCNHYYCETCIEMLAKRAKGEPFDYPECRKETSLPPGGVVELQGAFFVERMKDVYSTGGGENGGAIRAMRGGKVSRVLSPMQ